MFILCGFKLLLFKFEDKMFTKIFKKEREKNLHMYFTHIIDQP